MPEGGVNYRKQVSPSLEVLLPEEEFRLYAVCSRSPQKLAGAVELAPVQAGVYDCRRGSDVIRLIVAHELPKTENNSLLHLLSASPDQVLPAALGRHEHATESTVRRLRTRGFGHALHDPRFPP